MGYYVPETLKELDNWVLWRLEDTGKGKPSKVPYSPITGRRANIADRRTWGSYSNTVTRLEHDDFNGIGFVFTEEDNLIFIDLDNCFTPDGEETAFAEEVQALFPDTYTEISQSENGLHIVCRGRLPKAIKRKEIEMYSAGRYMAFTGNATSATEPRDGQAGIDTLYKKYAATSPNKAVIMHSGQLQQQTIEELLEVIRSSRQGMKFERLLAGDWTGYRSQSEADQAFINIANYFTKSNENMILELWQRSALSHRDKGSRIDYISRMIENARNTYTGSKTVGRPNRARVTDQPQNIRKRRF